MEITTILVVVNIVVSALSPIISMIGRIRHSKCLGAEMDVGTPEKERSEEQIHKTS
jgi:hypothetical protein